METQLIGKKLSLAVAAGTLTLGLGLPATSSAVEEGVCGPMDVVFVVDDTGSMGGAIDNVKSGIAAIAADVVTASGGDYQMGLVSFKDAPETDVDLAPSNDVAIQAAVAGLFATAGAGGPEASDASLDTVVNGTNPGSDAGPCGDAFNALGWRPGATKIAVMLTDNLPGGCNDAFTPGVDDTNAARVAGDASAGDIKISAIYNSNFPSALVVDIMTNYAATTGGVFVQTPASGAGTEVAIQDIIASCGSSADECPLSQGYWKNHEEHWDLTDMTIGGTFYTAVQLDGILETPPKKGNSYLILAHQLIAARLNIANGSDPTVISDTLADAEGALAGVNLLSDYIKDEDMNALAEILDDYNNRALTPDCEESEGNDEV